MILWGFYSFKNKPHHSVGPQIFEKLSTLALELGRAGVHPGFPVCYVGSFHILCHSSPLTEGFLTCRTEEAILTLLGHSTEYSSCRKNVQCTVGI